MASHQRPPSPGAWIISRPKDEGLLASTPEAAPRVSARVMILDAGWRRLVPGVAACVARAARVADTDACVVLAGDRLVRDLNTRHRGRAKPTNILTYESPEPEMVLALGVIRREAAALGRRVSHHLSHLVIHGALHLRGHDHDHPGDARRMEMEEARLLRRLCIPNPWKRA